MAAHLKAVRRYAAVTGRSLYSFGWLLDVARGLYTIRTGRVASKTDAGRWALQNALCPDPSCSKRRFACGKRRCACRMTRARWIWPSPLGTPLHASRSVLEEALR